MGRDREHKKEPAPDPWGSPVSLVGQYGARFKFFLSWSGYAPAACDLPTARAPASSPCCRLFNNFACAMMYSRLLVTSIRSAGVVHPGLWMIRQSSSVVAVSAKIA